MLEKPTRKKLLEHNWVDIMKRDTNPTQTWRRIRDQAIRGLNDLTLLAKKLPDDKQQEIFDNKVRDFFSAILRTDQIDTEFIHTPNLQYPAHNYLDHRRTRLAAILIKEALHWCIYQHNLLFRETPTQSKLIIEQLVRSEKICEELAYKLHMTKLEADSREENLIYLFAWDELIQGRHEERLAEFLRRVTRSVTLDIDDLKFTKDTITCNFTMDASDPGTASMKRNNENTSAILSIKDEIRNNVINFQLLIKNEQNIFHLYIKDNLPSVKKKRRHKNKLMQ
jgi:hypothetical protein